jgi:hypothetical protein
MDIATFTDQDIDNYCESHVAIMRDELWAQRYAARYKAMLDASLENRFATIEEEMTDACKAVDFPPHASRFPTKAQLAKARQPQMVGVSIAVSAAKLQGKTSLLLMILDMLADAGALSVEETRWMTNNIGDFVHCKRGINEEVVETLDLDLDLNVLYEMGRRTSR